MDFSNKNVIVTGGASGIGKEVVRGIVEGKGHAIIFDINLDMSLKLQEELGIENVSVYIVDLQNSDNIRQTTAKVYEDLKKVDVIINNAGIVSTKPFEQISQEEWERVLQINLSSVYTMIHANFEHMKKNKYGRIVNVASVAAKKGGGLLGTSAYAASKAGVIGLTKAIAREGAPYNICCNAVCPSLTLTPMTSDIGEEKTQKIIDMIPLKRAASPREIANVILFYASDLASFVTGEISDVDGGITMDG